MILLVLMMLGLIIIGMPVAFALGVGALPAQRISGTPGFACGAIAGIPGDDRAHRCCYEQRPPSRRRSVGSFGGDPCGEHRGAFPSAPGREDG